MMNPKPSLTFLGLVVALAVLQGAAALAEDSVFEDRIGDSVDPHPDIVEAVAGEADGGRLQHTIRADHVFADPASPCLAIREVYPGETSLYVCHDGKIRKVSNRSVVAEAVVTRPDGHSVVYTFARKGIDGATAYRWRAEARAPECDHDRCDVAPDTFALREQVVTYEQWAIAFLDEVNAPNCESNRIAMLAWEANEGTAAVFNPLATTYFLKGSTKFNSVGVRNYLSLAQGVKAQRLTLEKGSKSYDYGPILDKLDACAPPLATAKAIRASSWCSGCSSGQYVTGLIDDVRNGYKTYAGKLISTHPEKRTPEGVAIDVTAARDAGLVPA